MKNLKFSILLLFFVSFSWCFSQETPLTLLRSDDSHWTYCYRSGALLVSEKSTDEGLFTQLLMPQHQSSVEEGAPQLPLYSSLLEIPFCEEVKIEILNEKIKYVKAADLNIFSPIYPAQKSYSKNEEPEGFVKNSEIYLTNAFYGFNKVNVEMRGAMRWANLAALTVAPVQYNPVTEEFAIIEELVFSISFEQPDLTKTNAMRQLHGNSCFARQFDEFLLPSPIHTKAVIYPSPVTYLIISHPMFEQELQRFIAWKQRLGFVVEVAYTNNPEVGNTTESIRQFVRNKYITATAANPAPTYLLLVGDVEQIPAFRGTTKNFPTDLYYAEWTGDYLPDCYYGRFSAQNVSQLAAQIDKTLAYERCDFEDATYLNDAVLVAGFDKTFSPKYSNGQVNYLNSQYVNERNGFRRVRKIRDEDGVKPEVIRAEVAKGVGFVNYSAHCGTYGWRIPRFDTTHVKELPSVDRYCFMLANCCESGKFDVPVCFAEAMMRAPNKGAASYIGASEDTYWDEDYYWTIGYRSQIDSLPSYEERHPGAFDKMFHTHGENPSLWAITNGAVVAAGNLSVEKSPSAHKRYYWEIYHVFGDPSMIVWLTQPKPMPLLSRDTLSFGATFLAVETAPYASVVLTHNQTWIASANANAEGKVSLRFPMLTQLGNYELSASAQHYTHGFKSISLSPADSLQLLVNDLPLSAHSSMTVGNSVTWNLSLSNVGKTSIDSIRLHLACDDNRLQFVQQDVLLDSLSLKDTTLQSAFVAILPDSIVDQSILNLYVIASYAQKNDTTHFFFNVAAPDFLTMEYDVEEENGDEDGLVEAGETIRLTIISQNVGHVYVDSLKSSLSTDFDGVNILTSEMMSVDESKTSSFVSQFDFEIADDVAPLSVIPFCHKMTTEGMSFVDTLYVMVGCAMEDFESGGFSTFRWKQGEYPWRVVKTNAVSGDFCARSAENCPHAHQSSFSILLDVLHPDSVSFYRKVSSEINYDFFLFYIDETEVDRVSGEEGWTRVSFPVSQGTHLFTFTYQKDNADNEGLDAAFVDNIQLPASGNVLASIQTTKSPVGRVFPNPASDKFVVESETPILTLEIFDISGKCIDKISNIASHFCEIDIHRLKCGSYLVRTMDVNKEVAVYKLIKY